MKSLRVSFPLLTLGTWHAHPPVVEAPGRSRSYRPTAVIRRANLDGTEVRGLPDGCRSLEDELGRCETLLADHYRYPSDDRVDVTAGWDTDRARLSFLEAVEDLRAAVEAAVGSGWDVDIDPVPGVVTVRLMGEYFCDWPLWTSSHGGTGQDSWPQLSAEIGERLTAWAVRAEPDHDPQPSPDETELLRRDLQAELGERFRVTSYL